MICHSDTEQWITCQQVINNYMSAMMNINQILQEVQIFCPSNPSVEEFLLDIGGPM